MTPPNRLKFRFWDASIVGFQYFEFDDFKRRPPEVLAARILYAKEWQQSTGLLDRNQMEIFEGDILSSDQYVINPANHVAVVKWRDGAFGFDIIALSELLRTDGLIDSIVIGNIYEHSELLK